MKASTLSRQSPFVYFWLGILTGAIVTLSLLMIQPYGNNGAASVVRDGYTETAEDAYYTDDGYYTGDEYYREVEAPRTTVPLEESEASMVSPTIDVRSPAVDATIDAPEASIMINPPQFMPQAINPPQF